MAQAEAARAKAARAATAQADAAWSERARPEGTWATARWTDAAQFEIARETGPTVQAVRAVSMAAATLGAAAHAVPAAVAPTPTTATESDDARSAPAPIGRLEASTPVVQLAAAPSEEAAHSFWQDLVHRFPEALGQREPVVIRFEHGGTVFWRVRAEGFATPAEAQTLCARMRADGQECFVPRS